MNLKIKEWDQSYLRGENFVWYPENDMVRFISKYYVKKIDIDKFSYNPAYKANRPLRGLDFGCGIGRGVFLMDDYGIEAHGVDISTFALDFARKTAKLRGKEYLEKRFYLFDGESGLPYSNEYFDMIVAHGVFDSMSFETAKKNISLLERVLNEEAFFYLDLISDDSNHPVGYDGEETVKTVHEQNTIQSYFTMEKIEKLIRDTKFKIHEVIKKKTEDLINNTYHSRFYIVLRKEK